MTEQAMLKEMFGGELAQVDLKAIGKSRGFDAAILASPELLQHVFLSEQGVAAALASLTEPERLTLHLLTSLGEEVDSEFFKRLYPEAVPKDSYYSTYTERFKGLFQQVKTQLIRRGLLLFGTLPEPLYPMAMLERRRFRFPLAFAPLLPPPFPVRQVAAAGEFRHELLRHKLLEILSVGAAPATPSKHEEGRWRLVNGDLLFSGQPFRAARLLAWPMTQWKAAVPYTAKGQPEALQPVPLLRYALSRLRPEEWLAPAEILPFWQVALPGAKAPEPQTVCEAGFQSGCLEQLQDAGTILYRWPQPAEADGGPSPETFLDPGDPRQVAIDLERVSPAALERLGAVSRLALAENRLWAEPHLLKISHAPAATLADPLVQWLREHHPAFRSTMDTVEQKRGKLLVHENLLVACIRDLSLKVMLEKKFGQPGQLIALAGDFVAFPKGLLPEIQSWMKKSGHVIKNQNADETH